MSLWLLVVVVPVLLVAALVVVVVVVLLAGRTSAPDPSQAAAAARRHAGAVSAVAWLGLVLALLIGPTLAGSVRGLTQGVLLGLVPAVAGVLFVGVHAIGELTWPRPTGTVRRAVLERRGPADVAPPALRRLLWGWTALVAVVAALGAAVATDGRQISRTVEQGAITSSPFPGWFYGLPLLLACLAVLVAAEAVLRVVASRPAVVDAQPRWDAALRRLSAHRVLRGAQLVVGLTAAGLLLTAGMTLQNVGGAFVDDGDGSTLHAVSGQVAVVLAIAVGLTAVVVAFIPGRAAGQLAPSDPLPAPPLPR